jgi:hypothetical protein
MSCGHCGETFHGYGHGPTGERQAYREAFDFLKTHTCLLLTKPNPLPMISGTALDAIIEVIQKAMPDVTITHDKV